MAQHKTLQELEAALPHIHRAGKVSGHVGLIVRRPATNQREVLESCELSRAEGLVGDNWQPRGNRKTPDGAAHPDTQITLMNVRVIEAIAPDRDAWPLAGDQFYVDLDLSRELLPPGSCLRIGGAVLTITAEPHLGCLKFAERFGRDAVQFVNSDAGKLLNLRGVNARVLVPGTVKTGDTVLNLYRLGQSATRNQTAEDSHAPPSARVFIRNFSGSEAETALRGGLPADVPARPHCSFCGRLPEAAGNLVAGNAAWICSECAVAAAKAAEASRPLPLLMQPQQQNHRCSFCGTQQDAADDLLAGPGVFICRQCSAMAAAANQQ